MTCSACIGRSMAEATFPLSIVFALQGIAAAVLGKWALDVSEELAIIARYCTMNVNTSN